MIGGVMAGQRGGDLFAEGSDLLRRRGRAIVWLLFVVGILITLAGVLLSSTASGQANSNRTLISSLLATLGAGLVGAILGIVITEYLEKSSMEQVKEMLIGTLKNTFVSPESELEQLRRPLYRYHATLSDGKYVWRGTVYHFESSVGVGTLEIRVDYPDETGVWHRHRIEAGIRGDRLLIFGIRLTGQEQVSISVYPGMTAGYKKYHCGVSFIESYDSREVIARSIVSYRPLVSEESGFLPDASGKKLDELWEKDIATRSTVLLSGLGRVPGGNI
jgi:hypothetical protein